MDPAAHTTMSGGFSEGVHQPDDLTLPQGSVAGFDVVGVVDDVVPFSRETLWCCGIHRRRIVRTVLNRALRSRLARR